LLVSVLVAQLTGGTPAPPPSPTLRPVMRISPEDGIKIQTPDGNFTAALGMVAQMAYDLDLSRRASGHFGVIGSNFNVRIVRPYLQGNILRPWIRYLIQPELANTPHLLDLQVDVQPIEALGLRVGQFRTPFSRTFLAPIALLQFFDFSFANTFFRGDRDTGAMLFGSPLDGRIEYFAGVFNGNGVDRGGNDNADMMWVARLAVSPLGAVAYDETPALQARNPPRFSVGVNGYVNRRAVTSQVIDAETQMLVTRNDGTQQLLTGGVDVAVRAGPWALQAEGYYRRTWPPSGTAFNAWGGYAQTSVLFLQWLELAERVSLLAPDTRQRNLAVGGDTQLNFYVLGNHLKAALRYTLLHTDAPTAGVATAGYTHTITAQGQVAF
jgi:hypothetical protein